MNLSDAMVQEFSQECATTRKLLERLPEDKFSWKPHEKSMSLGRLATHVVEIPGWAATIVKDEFFDVATADFKPVTLGSRAAVLESFQKNMDSFSALLKGKPDSAMLTSWKLKQGDHVILELPRAVALRSFMLSHIIHHRGQLSVYLRLTNVPVPSIYGRSADES